MCDPAWIAYSCPGAFDAMRRMAACASVKLVILSTPPASDILAAGMPSTAFTASTAAAASASCGSASGKGSTSKRDSARAGSAGDAISADVGRAGTVSANAGVRRG